MPKRTLVLTLILFVLAGLDSSTFAAAQDQNAELAGIITDASSAGLPGATLAATNLETGISSVTLTNSEGVYRFRILPPGKYRLSATLPGFRQRVYNSVSLAPSQHAQLNFSLISSPDPAPLPQVVDAPAVLEKLQPQLFPEPAPSSSQRVRVGGSVMERNLIESVPPVYPEEARAARLAGVVVMEVEVSSRGTVGNVRVVSGHPLLRQAAVDAVKKRLYTPVMLNGSPVEAVTTVTVNVLE